MHESLAARVAPAATDAELLRAHAPLLRFNSSELFLPTTVEAYVAQCGLWEITTQGEHRRLVDPGDLDIVALADLGEAYSDRTLYLRFVDPPLNRWQYWKWRWQGHFAKMPHASRFANVGISTRFVDALFRLTLVVRRRLPKGTVSGGETIYREQMPERPHPYYGRVVRDAGWTVCQYWFFYAMNDWRSSYKGINDHEADWETLNVYLAPDENGDLVSRWVASSSHDAEGDALRRRVDDPELEWIDGHVVVYAGAGSHSHAFAPVDELIRVEAPRMKRVVNFVRRLIAVVTPWTDSTGFEEGLGIPFVDYHRGDGVGIGVGGDREWEQVLIDDDTTWVSGFRGRWGRDTGDRFGAESGPTGPRYERNGIDRTRWNDPVGWAGLQKVNPDANGCTHVVTERIDELDELIAEVDATLDEQRVRARGEMVQAQAMEIDTVTSALAKRRYMEAREREAALLALADRRRRLSAERASLARALSIGMPPTGPRDHLRARPLSETVTKANAVLRAWSAISTSVILGILIWLLVGNASDWYWQGVILGVVILVGVESAARKRLPQFIASLAVLSAAVIVVIAVVHEWRYAFAAILGLIALYLLVENLRELINR